MDKMKAAYEVMLGLAAEMVWDEALRKRRCEMLQQEIDAALANGDELAFLALTSELNTLENGILPVESSRLPT
ncbi:MULTISPECIES: IDEAL domain-containing protein [Saccharibacillus]|uniref:IDEAL domain-containing protein n=1 Tax=Saccharibacillus brassicae TaxID=2583377 RepID=A0A4Y6UPD4_SACBS|nr:MULTISPECIES: IDEAL domain-containing protein [Saccharibacillus]MWJ33384.1 IDEAL domain-containing protein [Saccharibacillus sp. WB 17]QDH19493.1 IDEAL domain-containing protein [Saccharibacillus brassicae]